MLNFAERTGSGAVMLVWSYPTNNASIRLQKPTAYYSRRRGTTDADANMRRIAVSIRTHPPPSSQAPRLMSVFDQQRVSNNTASCFGFCFSPEDPNHDVFTQQKNSQHKVTRDEERKKKEVDDHFTAAFNKLTFEERQRQQEVLHGVDEQIAEEATFIHSTLQELDNHLKRIKQGSAYEMAERLDPEYVSARAFRVMFLRGNKYDARISASQMLRFFEVKQKLFGVEKMVKDITLEDLDEDDRASLRSGWLQLHGKDRSGRLIFVQYPGLRLFKNLINELRGKFYFIMRLAQSEEAQLKGIVGVIYAVEELRDSTGGIGFVENTQVSLAIPVYVAGFHTCCSDVREYALFSLVVKVLPAKLISRNRIHCGSHLECQYRLCSFGISRLQINALNRGLLMQSYLFGGDGANLPNSTSSMAIQPNANDVLYTGNKTSNNPGNHYLRNLVIELWQVYDSASNEKKRVVVDEMVEKINSTGGRFLRTTSDEEPYWVESPIEEVRIKVAQMFRNQKRAIKRVSSRQMNVIDGTPIAGSPLPSDVVFGKSHNTRGKEYMHHQIRERSEEYNALDRGTKATVVVAVMETIKGKGGRFLQPIPYSDGFLEVSDEKARERISKYFRNYRRIRHK
ncbi:unnamed protein product [Cylindrotheca closterium]|uniref:DUF6824 domain-containing protein n=1 Tax=Cylindrotheca closterium TaxID=2856 RepID=A0AAD2JH54_9STRA|nr:unnamed protein product [Cylindrotheca closterium]